MTKQAQQRRLETLEKELKEETRKNGDFSKRAVFLKATVNLALKELGKNEKYVW